MHWWYQSEDVEKIGTNDAYPSQWISNMAPLLSALAIHCSRIFLLASSRFLTIKTRGVLFDTLLQNNPRSEKVKAEKWTRKCDDVRNAWRTKNSKMTTHQSAHFSSDNFSFNLAKIHKRGAKRGVYSIVQPTVLLQKAEFPPWKNTFFWNEKLQHGKIHEKLILLVRG